MLTNLQRGNTKAQTSIIGTEELNFHQRAAQGDLTIKDIEQGKINFVFIFQKLHSKNLKFECHPSIFLKT